MGAQACLPGGNGFANCDCGDGLAGAAEPMGAGVPAVDAGLLPTCTPSETRACVGVAACEGTQSCTPAGDGFGSCACTVPPAALAPNVVGAECQANSDCGPELECWSGAASEYLGIVGGAPHGYCTAECFSNTDCPSLDVPSYCWSQPGARGMCVTSCLSKDPALTEIKCLNRADLTCWSSAALGLEVLSPARQSGLCLPSCNSDADCPNRFCNLATGLCTDAAAPGAPVGTPCVVDAECAGALCLPFDNGTGVCSAQCTFGSGGCGYSGGTTPREAVCAIPYLQDDFTREGYGDLGLCLELCDVQADCTATTAVCRLAENNTGRAGACDPSVPLSPDAGAP